MGYYACYCRKISHYSALFGDETICYEYAYATTFYTAIQYVISFFIQIMNLIFRNVNLYFIERIGYDSKS